MNEVIFTQNVTMLDIVIRISLFIGTVVILVISAIERHKDKRERKRLEKWLNGENHGS